MLRPYPPPHAPSPPPRTPTPPPVPPAAPPPPRAHGASAVDNDPPTVRCGALGPLQLLVRHPNGVALVGLVAAEITRMLNAEEIGQGEPGVPGPLADPAVGNAVVSGL